jgi:hypothetical protein
MSSTRPPEIRDDDAVMIESEMKSRDASSAKTCPGTRGATPQEAAAAFEASWMGARSINPRSPNESPSRWRDRRLPCLHPRPRSLRSIDLAGHARTAFSRRRSCVVGDRMMSYRTRTRRMLSAFRSFVNFAEYAADDHAHRHFPRGVSDRAGCACS